MYCIQYTAFSILLLHQCVVNGFNIFDKDLGFNYLNREINFLNSPLVSDEKITRKHEKTRWISQEVDHFNSSDNRKWQMKYYEGLKYWSKDGPIYLFLTVEGAHESHMRFRLGLMKALAKETQGAMYCIEHRYYGDSKPFTNLDTENIKYLSSQQALADIAKLINHLKSLPMYKNSKVVVMGGSYGGNLAAWMKVLYPNIIDAAISSSAPVLAKKELLEFLHNVIYNYKYYGGTECINNIKRRFENYDLLLQSSEGINKLKRDENICDACDMTVLENQQFFFWKTTLPFMVISTYGFPDLIKFHCDSLDNVSNNRFFLNAYSKFNNSEIESCISYDLNKVLNKIHENRNLNTFYTSLYQYCSEFGHFPTTTSKDQPFLNIPMEFYIKVCSGLFGKNMDEKRVDIGVENSNKLYGGLKPNVTKVVFTSGDMDTLSTLSVLKDLSHDAPAVIIPGEFHALHLFLNSDKGSDELKKARELVSNLIRKWIGAGEHLR